MLKNLISLTTFLSINIIMKKTDCKFIYTFRVRYAEVDAQGIVFNAHYLTYFDCLITEYYRKLKYNYALEVKKNQKDFIRSVSEYGIETSLKSLTRWRSNLLQNELFAILS